MVPNSHYFICPKNFLTHARFQDIIMANIIIKKTSERGFNELAFQ